MHDSGTSAISMTQEVQNAIGCQTESNTGMTNVRLSGQPKTMTKINDESLCSLSQRRHALRILLNTMLQVATSKRWYPLSSREAFCSFQSNNIPKQKE